VPKPKHQRPYAWSLPYPLREYRRLLLPFARKGQRKQINCSFVANPESYERIVMLANRNGYTAGEQLKRLALEGLRNIAP